MCSTVYVAQCVHVCVCLWGRGVGEGSKMFFHSQQTFSDSKDNIIWPQMSPLTSANKNPQRNTDANCSYRWQWTAQPIASGVRVYTASPHPPPPTLSLSLPQWPVCIPTTFLDTRPKPLWPHRSPRLHLNLPPHAHFLFNTRSSLQFFLLLSTMLCQLLALNWYFCLLSPDVTLAIVERIIAGNCFILLLLVCLYVFFVIFIFL